MIAGPTMAVYSSLKTRKEVPHVDTMSLVRTLVWVASLDLMCYR
jgi:hypothetical protein